MSERHITPVDDEIEHDLSRDCWCSPRPPTTHEWRQFSLPVDAVVHRPSWQIEEIIEAERVSSKPVE